LIKTTKYSSKRPGSILLFVICTIIALSTGGTKTSSGNAPDSHSPRYVAHELLVKFHGADRAEALQHYRQRHNMEILHSFRSIGVDHIRLSDDLTVEQSLAILRSDPAVIYAEPNYYRSVDDLPSTEFFPLLWGLHNTGQSVNGTAGTVDADIDAPEAWEVRSSNADVVVAVIDSGLDFSHPALTGNIWTNPGELADNGVDDDGNGYVDDTRGWDFINNDNMPLPNDGSGHGTHVSGTIAANGRQTTGMAGVSEQAHIMSLRTMDAYGTGDTAGVILAFEYAKTMGAAIINCSWGGAGYSQALKDVIDASSALVVCAAGNSGSDSDLAPHYPAAFDSPNIIVAAATDANDNLASFSNYGALSVDLAAPGVNIFSCAPGRRTIWSDDFNDGTFSDWISGGPNNDWGLSSLESISPPYSLSDSPEGNYSQRTNSWIRPPLLNLSDARLTSLVFKIKGRSESDYDNLLLEVSTDGNIWNWKPVKLSGIGVVNSISGTIAEWTEAMVDLSLYDGLSSLYLRFSFTTDWTNNYDGWYIDDVAVTAASASYDGNEYTFMTGTSMAAPHVSGVAVLIKAENQNLTTASMKSILLESIDPRSGLEGILFTGSRLNAFKAISILDSGTLQFESATYTVFEDADSAALVVNRTGGDSGAVSVNYEVTGGTAIGQEDYTLSAGSLSWADGETGSKTFSIDIINDAVAESYETLEIALTTATGGAIIGSPAKTLLMINDDDGGSSFSNFKFWLMVLPVIINNN